MVGLDGRLLDNDHERCIDWLEEAMRLQDKKAFEDLITLLWNIWNNQNNYIFWGKDDEALVVWDHAKALSDDIRIHNLSNGPMIPKTLKLQRWINLLGMSLRLILMPQLLIMELEFVTRSRIGRGLCWGAQ